MFQYFLIALKVESYRRDRNLHVQNVEELQIEIDRLNKELLETQDSQERKFLEEKAQIYRDLDNQKISFREVIVFSCVLSDVFF